MGGQGDSRILPPSGFFARHSTKEVIEMSRRTYQVFLAAVLGIFFCPNAGLDLAFGQEKFPTKPITLTIGYGAGGGTDVSTRPLANAASKILGQPVVVVNKPGGATSIAMAGLKNEKPDGYNVGTLGGGGFLAPMTRKVNYDVIKDFTPILQFAIFQFGLVVQSDSPWKTFQEFINYAKANPGKIRYSTSGVGNPQHLIMERLALKEKIKWTLIPYESGEQAVTALLGNHVEASSQTTTWKKYVDAGRFRLLAFYGEKRMPVYPNVPTLKELGYDMTAEPALMSLVGPKGMSAEVVETIHQAFKKAMEDPDFIRVSNQVDQPPFYRSPQDLAKYLVDTHDQLAPLVRTLGLRK
jgi:tripartite-type tricarboxylate transporter receptor subunit TctC